MKSSCYPTSTLKYRNLVHEGLSVGGGSSAGSRPGSRATFVSAKVAKTIAAPSGLIGGEGRQPYRRAAQLAGPVLSLAEGLKHGPPIFFEQQPGWLICRWWGGFDFLLEAVSFPFYQ